MMGSKNRKKAASPEFALCLGGITGVTNHLNLGRKGRLRESFLGAPISIVQGVIGGAHG